MASIFLRLLNLSISASWLVLFILVLRFAFRRLPKWVTVLLWGIAALRLVLPFSIESALSLIPSAETFNPDAMQIAFAPTVTSGIPMIDRAANPSLGKPLYPLTEIAGTVWLIGLAAMLLYLLLSDLYMRKRVSASLLVRDNIYLCDAIPSPFILGVRKPRIYLPSALDEIQTQNVLAHEYAHLARRDHWWKPFGFLLLAVYWFNPVLWLAYILFCRDIELACDERVIRNMDENSVKIYSTVLLACSAPRQMIIACPLAFGEAGVKERVRNALCYKKPALWVIVLSMLLCIAAAVCFLTNPEHETMKWAKNLRAEDVARIELLVMPQAADKQYQELSADERIDAVELINKSNGHYVRKSDPLSGSTSTLYVTMKNGSQHTVTNNGNVYLCIDGDTYRSSRIAWPYTEGDSPLPDNFQIDDVQVDSSDNRVFVDNWSIRIAGQWHYNSGAHEWKTDTGNASLLVAEQANLADELDGLRNAGYPVEELDGFYRCVTQDGMSGTVVYLYPTPSDESCYWVEAHWSYDGADEATADLQAEQLLAMAESFRLEK